MIYVYDNTFNGFITAISSAFRDKDAEILADKHYTQPTFFNTTEIITDDALAAKVLDRLETGVSKQFVYELFIIYLSDDKISGNVAVKYIKDALKHGNKIHSFIQLPSVHEALRLKNKVLLENHRLKGLLRFKKYSDVMVADITPDHNIIPILYHHFERRLPNENWIIRDIKRNEAAIHFEKETQLVSYNDIGPLPEIKDEYEDVWCAFYKSIAIKERKNPKQRLWFMPKRYWKNMVEMKDVLGI